MHRFYSMLVVVVVVVVVVVACWIQQFEFFFPVQAGLKAIRDGFTRCMPNAGTMELRKAICNKLQGVCTCV
jgi:hypothetical protein